MAKYRVLQRYKDLELGRHLEPREEVEMTVKRADEVNNGLAKKGFKKPFLARIHEKKEDEGE